MKLINADELKSKFLEMGCMDNEPCYGAEIINRMPTVQAVPIDVLDKIRAEIYRQEKWLLHVGYTAYNVYIAFDAIKAVVSESEG